MAQWNKNTSKKLNNNNTLFEMIMMSDQEGNIINTFGSASNIPLANGSLTGYTAVHKFGMIDGTVGSGWSTVWSHGETTDDQLYPWSASSSAATVTSSSGSDTTPITLEGLDTDYNFQTETLTLSGTSNVVGIKVWSRVNRAFMSGTETNIGVITVSNAIGVVLSEIKAGRGQTLQALYTVPSNCTAFLSSIQMTSSKNQVVEVSMFARPFGGAFRIVGGSVLYQSDHTIEYSVPIKFTEKTDIDIRTIGASGGTVSSAFYLIVVNNSLL